MKLEELIAMIALMGKISVRNAVLFIINSYIDGVIEESIPDEIKSCVFYEVCMIEASYNDIKKVLSDEETDINSVDCLINNIDKCMLVVNNA